MISTRGRYLLLAETKVLTAYSIGKAERIFDLLEAALARGVRVLMVVNRLQEQHDTVRQRLEQFQQKYPYFALRSFEPDGERGDLHAKILVVDRKRALVGSSNLSYNGMVLNHELSLVVGEEDATRIASAIDELVAW